MQLENHVAIITGGGSGIGRAICLRLAKEGANIVIPDINLPGAEETAKLVEKLGRSALPIKCDITDPTQVKQLIEKTIQAFKRITILVNNAGVNIPAPFLEFPLESWEKVLKINLTAVFLCTQYVAKQMVKQGEGGRIINIASIAAFNRYPGSVAYPVSKGGVVQLGKTVAAELAPYGITVNSIAPGTTLTDMTKKMLSDKEAYEREVSMIPLKRFADPEEIAGVAAFLVSKDAAYITGETIIIDGGWMMR